MIASIKLKPIRDCSAHRYADVEKRPARRQRKRESPHPIGDAPAQRTAVFTLTCWVRSEGAKDVVLTMIGRG